MTRVTERLYRRAVAADEAFSAELRRVYGDAACEARYRDTHADPGVMRAMRRKLRADGAWAGRVADEAGRAIAAEGCPQ